MILKHIKPLPNLTLLDISDCANITAKGIEAFGTHCKSLIHLKRNMWKSQKPSMHILDDSEAETIANTMPNIQRLEFFYARFGDSGLSEILNKCKSLTHLDIQSCWNVELRGDFNEICITERLKSFIPPWYYGDSDSESEYAYESDKSESESESG
ncbi:hypothetical protein L1887_18113 [Cichorium endivia]|nr:hypothetical protein L1887_18113 [Cichorium endivia]